MGNASKIRRYRNKDYSAVVDFPVEIVGRDGLVRRYSFEESIRLYQRRIANAELRYDDQDVIRAEKQHCLSRIDQLRRSFFAHYGWPEVAQVDQESEHPTMLAAEVAAFLRRCLSAISPDPDRFNFSCLERAEAYTVYFIQPPPENGRVVEDALIDGHFLLYVFRFDAFASSPNREAFFDLIKVLDGVRSAQRTSVESLIAFFHTHDCGLILTGSGSVVEDCQHLDMDRADDSPGFPPQSAPDVVESGMRLLGRGRFEEALRAFEQGYVEHHYRRVAYLGAAVVADQLGMDDAAEAATVMGCQYFPGDPAIVYHRAVNLMRRGEFNAARETLERIREWPQGEAAAGFLRGLCCLAVGPRAEGKRLVKATAKASFRYDAHLAKGARWVVAQIWARNVLILMGGGMAAVGFHGLLTASWSVGLFAPLGLVAVRLVFASWRRQLLAQILGPGGRRLRLSSSSVLISADGSDPLRLP